MCQLVLSNIPKFQIVYRLWKMQIQSLYVPSCRRSYWYQCFQEEKWFLFVSIDHFIQDKEIINIFIPMLLWNEIVSLCSLFDQKTLDGLKLHLVNCETFKCLDCDVKEKTLDSMKTHIR